MKRLFVLFVLISNLACDRFIDEITPSDQLSIDDVFTTGKDLSAALVGAYDGVQHGALLGRNTVLFGDLWSGNVDYLSGAFTDFAFLTLTADQPMVEDMWAQFYKTVNQLNIILASIDPIVEQDSTFSLIEANSVRGEALALRAVLYFEMLRLFGQPEGSGQAQELGLPLLLEPILRQAQFRMPSRAGIREVYDQCQLDLEVSAGLLSEEVRPYRVTRFVAWSYLARLSFQLRQYEEAADWATLIINSQQFHLNTRPQDFYLQEGSPEEIWSIYNALQDDIEGFGLSSVYHGSGPNQAFVGSELLKEGFAKITTSKQQTRIEDLGWQVVDLRTDEGLLADHPLILGGGTFSNKYENPWLDTEDDTPILRLAEILLMRAEALARIEGINQESIDLLNQVRARSLRVINGNGEVLPDQQSLVLFSRTDFTTPDQLIETIILERRVELAFEGNRFHDLTRLKRDIKGLPYDAPALRLPIPQREMDLNPNLIQNPGY